MEPTVELKVLRAVSQLSTVSCVVANEQNEELFRSSAPFSRIGRGESLLFDRFLREGFAKLANGDHNDTFEVFSPPRASYLVHFSRSQSGPAFKIAVIEDSTLARQNEMARRDLVTNISHELRTPVGAIALLAETLIEEPDLGVAQQLASRIFSQTQRLVVIIEDVLALSRLESSTDVDHVLIDIGSLLNSVVSQARQVANDIGFDIELIDDSFGLMVSGDRALLKSAVGNLIDNAIKYSDKGIPIRVSAKAIKKRGVQMVQIRVVDGGIGIPQRDRQRIFERFYRVDKARSRDTGGSGVGLALVRHVAVSHYGYVEVDSLEGEGSTFTLSLPVASGIDLEELSS